MTFHIGVFRFGMYNYASYRVYFHDVSGLKPKAEIKISGVKVGWVDDIKLLQTIHGNAEIKIMIHKDYPLRENAYAIIRQDGLLGAKYLEIEPGDKMLAPLAAGGVLGQPGKPPVEIDELLRQTQRIATNIEEVTSSLKNVLSGPERQEQLSTLIDNMSRTFDSIKEIVPSIEKNVQKIGNVFDQDFRNITHRLESTIESIDQMSKQINESFGNINSVARKIDEGKGLIGKLINEDETYQDIKATVEGVKNYFARNDDIGVILDSHFESMYAPAENYTFEDSKGYFDIRIHPSEDRFYQLQFIASQKGTIERRVFTNQWYDQNCRPLNHAVLDDRDKFRFPWRQEEILQRRDTFKFGLQLGKIFDNLAFRFGIMESSAGVGIDYEIPFDSENLRWVTTLEAFDMRGRDRINDNRPHLKWLNKVFVLNNIFFTFGADDFISRHNANGFFGIGIRFGDDDIKYLASSFGSLGGSGALGNTSLRC